MCRAGSVVGTCPRPYKWGTIDRTPFWGKNRAPCFCVKDFSGGGGPRGYDMTSQKSVLDRYDTYHYKE